MDWVGAGWLGGALVAAVICGYGIHLLLWWGVSRFARRTSTDLDDSLVRNCRRPTVLIVPIVLVHVLLPVLRGQVPASAVALLSNVMTVLLPVSIGWTLARLLSVAQDMILVRYDVKVADNLRARAVHTQFHVLKRIGIVVIGVLTLSVILVSFPQMRQLGKGLLASAGLSALVIGLAAQRTLSNLLAGIQIVLTQPIRLDDVVIVEGEWGRVEEITLTYVVIRIWDLRRLILPISYFLETPFQNWTRVSAEILGTVMLHVDHTVPIGEIRSELERIVKESDKWDRKTCGVQVTGTSPEGIEVRALISAADASAAWDLRCEVREKLIEFVRERYPESLPRLRMELHGEAAGAEAGA